MKSLLAAALCLALLATLPAASAKPPAPVEGNCVVLVDQPDMGEKVCVDLADPDCPVYRVRTTFLGTETTCVVGDGGGCGNACAMAEPPCYDVYSRTDVGAYSIVRRNSCAAPEVYQCPYEGAPIDHCQPILQGAAAPEPQLDCYYVYTRNDVGAYSVVRRTSCSVPEVYHCPYEGAPIDRCERVDQLSMAAAAPAEPNCMPVYRETVLGPVRQVSRDSCHSEVYVCDNDGSHGADETALNYLGGQVSQPDPNGFAQCAWESTGLVGPALW